VKSRLSATDLEGLAVGMAAALTAIHGAGVVHRDLKPSNVLLSYFGPKVIDFGIARALDASASTATGKLMGSPGWMAPEQFAQRPVTAAVDIFVWGSLVAYAGTGRRPFGQGTVVEIVNRIRHESPNLEGLEGRLRELVEGCMAKQPEQRPTARAVLLELLGDHADSDPQAAATQLVQQSWVPPAAATSSRRWRLRRRERRYHHQRRHWR
jgi:serine/threonine protein kinase